MIYQSSRRTRRVSFHMTAAIVLVCAFSGCSDGGEERNYAIPGKLCDHSLPANDIAAFLPSGKKITVRQDIHTVTTVCEVAIDQKVVLTTTTTWRRANDSTESFAQRALKVTKYSADDGRFRYSDFEAFGKTRNCVAPAGGQELYTAVQAVGSAHRDAAAMKRLIKSFTAEVEASQDCTANVP